MPSAAEMRATLNRYPLTVVGDRVGVMWSSHRSRYASSVVPLTSGASPLATELTNAASAVSACLRLPRNVLLTCRGLPVTGSEPMKTRSRHTPGDRSVFVPRICPPRPAPASRPRLVRAEGGARLTTRIPCSTTQGPVAQWSERGTHNPLVVGSIPTGPTLTPSGDHVAGQASRPGQRARAAGTSGGVHAGHRDP